MDPSNLFPSKQEECRAFVTCDAELRRAAALLGEVRVVGGSNGAAHHRLGVSHQADGRVREAAVHLRPAAAPGPAAGVHGPAVLRGTAAELPVQHTHNGFNNYFKQRELLKNRKCSNANL